MAKPAAAPVFSEPVAEAVPVPKPVAATPVPVAVSDALVDVEGAVTPALFADAMEAELRLFDC
jgi:hypothetical protein